MFRVLWMSALGCCLAAAQTTKIDLQNQSRGVDFSAASYTKPAKAGTALPATCSTGEAYVLTTAVPGSNLYICTAANTWSLQGSATSGQQLDVAFSTDQAVGTGSQAVFNLSGTPVPGSLTVSVNGQIQEAGTLADYTQSGSTVTFAAPSVPESGDRVSFRYATASGTGTLTIGFATDTATGTGSQAAFQLASIPLSGSLLVSMNGQIQESGALADYLFSGNTVTFNTGSIPANGARLSFHYGFSTSGSSSGGQTSSGGAETFVAPGTTAWTVPTGVNRVFAQVWAGGGGGTGSYFGSGNGGGGGGYAEGWCLVSPGATMNMVVGAGGIAGVGNTPAGVGGDSQFGTCVHALGGGGGNFQNGYFPGRDSSMPGGYYTNTTSGAMMSYVLVTGGSGCNACAPSRNDQAGVGGMYAPADSAGNPGAIAYFAGGGGGSGADGNKTLNQTAGAGGLSARGGSGGNGGSVAAGSVAACTPGTAPAGGGGGGAWDGSHVGSGCAGARGQVSLWW